MMRLSLWMATLGVVAVSGMMTDPVTVGLTFKAGSQDPTSGSTGWALVSHGIAEKLFTVDSSGDIVPQMAESITKIDTYTWDITVRSDYVFSDGITVTPSHVVDALTELNQQNSAASATVGTMTVTATGGQVVRIVTELPHPVMKAVLAEWVFVIYRRDGANFLYTGPFKVDTFSDDMIEMSPNTYYPDGAAAWRPQVVIIKRYAGGDALADALDAGEVDVTFHLPIDRLEGLRNSATDLTLKSMLVGYHYMMFHNMKRAPLSDLSVRQAVEKALDRQLLTQTLQGGFGTANLFPQASPYYFETNQPQADPTGAAQLLDDAGWTLNGNGVREKDGTQLSIRLVAYAQRPGLELVQPVIAQTLADLGFVVTQTLTSADSWDELDAIMASRDWDLLEWAQHTLPAGDPQWFLNAFFQSDGGNNHAGINSSVLDTQLDSLGHADEGSARVAAAESVHNDILAEVPVSNLMTPSWHVGLSSRAASYVPWGADYYIVRADFNATAIEAMNPDMTSAGMQSSPAGLGLLTIAFAVALLQRIC
eukprot:CAMPEP_0178431600 /NCGR_PEP_ID=MMETSP0689_2-20121128/31938_1 /TAXON_ID=160604 /ORGANISM="Amphidinium massartii, Strain CS-259" /LENGTH=535 /DNA_ID=CAMNT_0020053531 /DNA_START=60 /DNA_END=1667 /DNA_ORIENTATION=-